MSPLGPGNKLQVSTALLPHAHHGKGSFGPANGLGEDHAALIQNHGKTKSSVLHDLGDAVTPFSALLLVAGGKEINITARNEALIGQFLGGPKHGPQAPLGVQGAAPPELAVGDLASKGRVAPLTGGLHHVMMVHEEDGLPLSPALPPQEKTAVEVLIGADSKYCVEQVPEQVVELIEYRFVRLVRRGDGLHSNHPGQLGSILVCAWVQHEDPSFLMYNHVIITFSK